MDRLTVLIAAGGVEDSIERGLKVVTETPTAGTLELGNAFSAAGHKVRYLCSPSCPRPARTHSYVEVLSTDAAAEVFRREADSADIVVCAIELLSCDQVVVERRANGPGYAGTTRRAFDGDVCPLTMLRRCRRDAVKIWFTYPSPFDPVNPFILADARRLDYVVACDWGGAMEGMRGAVIVPCGGERMPVVNASDLAAKLSKMSVALALRRLDEARMREQIAAELERERRGSVSP